MDKQTLRQKVSTRRLDLVRECPDFAERIAAFASDLEIPPHATVAGYWPMGDEADPRALMAALAAKGHALALPRVEAKNAPLVFHCWHAGDALVAHRFGMSEPHVDSQIVAPGVLLVPLLAFDADGYRLGYGGGFYDRALALSSPTAKAIGIAYAGQEVSALPREIHDRRLDAVLTENGIRHFRQA